jgi:formiminotetrahydrofolate cyclodeaminase
MVVGAAACALVAMVARICAGSPKYAESKPLADELLRRADALREEMLGRKLRDEEAFDAVVAARGDKEKMQRALHGAAEVPLEGARACLEALGLAAGALELHNANLISDVGCAAEFAHSALLACAYNVRINHKFMKNPETIARQRSELDRYERESTALLSAVRRALSDQI